MSLLFASFYMSTTTLIPVYPNGHLFGQRCPPLFLFVEKFQQEIDKRQRRRRVQKNKQCKDEFVNLLKGLCTEWCTLLIFNYIKKKSNNDGRSSIDCLSVEQNCRVLQHHNHHHATTTIIYISSAYL